MNHHTRSKSATAILLVVAILGIAACSRDSNTDSAKGASHSSSAPSAAPAEPKKEFSAALATDEAVRVAFQESLPKTNDGVRVDDAPVIGVFPEATLSIGDAVTRYRFASGLLVGVNEREIKMWVQDPETAGALNYVTYPINGETVYCEADQRLKLPDLRPGEFVTVWMSNGKPPSGTGTLSLVSATMGINVKAVYVHMWIDEPNKPAPSAPAADASPQPPFTVLSVRRGLLKMDLLGLNAVKRYKAVNCDGLDLAFN